MCLIVTEVPFRDDACGLSPSKTSPKLPHLSTPSTMKSQSILALTALASAGFAFGQATTKPVGYVTIECKSNSDTIVGVPLRKSADYAGTLGASPDTATVPGSAILTLSGAPGLTTNAFANTHYVKFTNTQPTAAAGDGQWFVITSNTSSSLTVDLNGGSISAASGAGLEILKFWTLAELFNPALSTTSAGTTGNAIVASTSTTLLGRRTSLLIPNYAGVGTNLSASNTFFIHNALWKEQGQGDTDRGSFQLWPDSYFIIRHPSAVTASTNYTVSGEVESDQIDVGLATRSGGAQDNMIALPRPVNTTLNALGLGGTAAFMSSTSTTLLGRRDQLLVFDNAATGINKSASATYFYHNGIWKIQGGGDTDRGADVIPAGAGFIVRKYQSAGGTANWDNNASY